MAKNIDDGQERDRFNREKKLKEREKKGPIPVDDYAPPKKKPAPPPPEKKKNVNWRQKGPTSPFRAWDI